nr:RNA-directed DNA polymerase, eukaryota, reverse transcriptase zinc-binding domain protein [Tanacetum cinerariifolium]
MILDPLLSWPRPDVVARFLMPSLDRSRWSLFMSLTPSPRIKSEGGLGLKVIHVWNEALMDKHLWNVVINKESIWVKWVKNHYLMDHTVWVVDPSHHSSWIWKQILALSNKIRGFVKVKIGGLDIPVPTLSKNNDENVVCKEKNFNVNEVWKSLKANPPKVIWLVLGASMYYIWRERNMGLFRDVGRSDEVIFKLMVKAVRLRLLGLNLKVTNEVTKASKIVQEVVIGTGMLIVPCVLSGGDCTRSSDWDWHAHSSLCSFWWRLAYGDGLKDVD